MISPARQIAYEVLLRVQTDGAYAGDVLHAKLSQRADAPPCKPEDAALATELTFGVLRWQRRLDSSIDAHTRGKTLHTPVRVALRMGAYQVLMLDRIPAHAAVNESVELVKRAGLRAASGLVNAVMRKLVADRASKKGPPAMPRGASAAERLAVIASHPTWLVERWLVRFGEEETAALLAANNAPAPVTVRMNTADVTGLGFDLPLGAGLDPAEWLAGAFRARGAHTDLLSQLDALMPAGLLEHQDEASQMVAHLLFVHRGQRVLDLCSAPGGKTLLLARATGPTGHVTAGDLHLHRLTAMQRRLAKQASFMGRVSEMVATAARTAGDAALAFAPAPAAPIQLIALDALRSLPFSKKFERILVDAPCSGTGTLARNPEIRWRLAPADLQDLQSRQRAILGNALDALPAGGRLVYSTCSLEPEENEQVVEAALAARSDCRLADGRAALAPYLAPNADVNRLFDAGGYFRTLPHVHRTDGFFAAIIEKD